MSAPSSAPKASRKRDSIEKQLLPPLPDKDITPAWGAFMATLVQIATEVDEARAAECVRVMWAEHRRFNLWRKVPDGLVAAVGELRARGVPVVVVSNSEGQLQTLFDNLGIGGAFDLVVDSHLVGVEKPDPRIFAPVLARFGVAAADALHLGDTWATDVVGARAAGIRVGAGRSVRALRRAASGARARRQRRGGLPGDCSDAYVETVAFRRSFAHPRA